jgi:uncharacterized protein (TIGR02271 family)
MTNQTVLALYDDRASAQQVLDELRAAGYRSEFSISGDGSSSSAASKVSTGSGGSTGSSLFSNVSSDLGAPASRTSSLTRLGVPESEAQVYSEAVRRGGVLLIGQVDDSHTSEVLEIIERHHPVDADERAELYRQGGWTGYDATAADYDETAAAEERSRYGAGLSAAASGLRGTNAGAIGTGTGTSRGIDTDREEVIPVVEESLQVGKRAVERGSVRVRTRIIETPVEETVSLRDETVHVERRAVSRDVTGVPADAFRERTIEVTETDEEAVVAKTARVVEEVVVRKDVTEEARTVRDTVRRTEVEVEDNRTDLAGKRPLSDRDLDRSDI